MFLKIRNQIKSFNNSIARDVSLADNLEKIKVREKKRIKSL